MVQILLLCEIHDDVGAGFNAHGLAVDLPHFAELQPLHAFNLLNQRYVSQLLLVTILFWLRWLALFSNKKWHIHHSVSHSLVNLHDVRVIEPSQIDLLGVEMLLALLDFASDLGICTLIDLRVHEYLYSYFLAKLKLDLSILSLHLLDLNGQNNRPVRTLGQNFDW